jgi:hypothetical protein
MRSRFPRAPISVVILYLMALFMPDLTKSRIPFSDIASICSAKATRGRRRQNPGYRPAYPIFSIEGCRVYRARNSIPNRSYRNYHHSPATEGRYISFHGPCHRVNRCPVKYQIVRLFGWKLRKNIRIIRNTWQMHYFKLYSIRFFGARHFYAYRNLREIARCRISETDMISGSASLYGRRL